MSWEAHTPAHGHAHLRQHKLVGDGASFAVHRQQRLHGASLDFNGLQQPTSLQALEQCLAVRTQCGLVGQVKLALPRRSRVCVVALLDTQEPWPHGCTQVSWHATHSCRVVDGGHVCARLHPRSATPSQPSTHTPTHTRTWVVSLQLTAQCSL